MDLCRHRDVLMAQSLETPMRCPTLSLTCAHRSEVCPARYLSLWWLESADRFRRRWASSALLTTREQSLLDSRRAKSLQCSLRVIRPAGGGLTASEGSRSICIPSNSKLGLRSQSSFPPAPCLYHPQNCWLANLIDGSQQ